MQTRFPTHIVDLNRGIFRILSDYTRLHFPVVSWRVLATPDAELDPTHLEVDEVEKEWATGINLRAYFVPEEESYPLTRFGLEQIRDVTLQIAVPDLVTSGLATMDKETGAIVLVCSIGDRFVYSTLEYDVKEIWRGPPFGNTDIPIYYFASAEKVRPRAELYAGI